MQDHAPCLPSGMSGRHLLCGVLGVAALPAATPALPRAVQTPTTEAGIAFMRRRDFPFGAVIVRDGEVLARAGRNLGKQEQDPTAHGEMVAIRRFLAAGPDKLKEFAGFSEFWPETPLRSAKDRAHCPNRRLPSSARV
ncbi:MAG TPA: hypothetical protein VFR71_03075 [Methyloceanibacter sp.]|nr:hypothetical protein [Methyloceanibacter sp.]